MNQSVELAFLASKLELLCGSIPDQPTQANVKLLFGKQIEAWTKGAAPARNSLIKFERSMEQFLVASTDPAVRLRIESELERAYGYSSLRDTPVAVISKILKKGSFSTEDEARAVRNFLSNQGNEDLVGSVKFEKLARMMITYGD